MILEKTVDLVKSIYKYHKILPPKINRVVIGLGYTGVELLAYAYEPLMGVANTLPEIINNFDCSQVSFPGKLNQKKPGELLEWAYRPPSLEKIIGIATLNAMSQHILQVQNPYHEIRGDLIEFLKIQNSSKILFIGNIGPLIKKVGRISKNITIVEKNPKHWKVDQEHSLKQDIVQLSSEEMDIDYLFCTGSSLVNDTLEKILEIFKKKVKKIILIGPSASMLPDILFDYGIDLIGGMRFFDSDSAIRVLQEGGGTKVFKSFGKKYNYVKEL
jgi:uncharacterized protein (DUF4213/DUF364 family)